MAVDEKLCSPAGLIRREVKKEVAEKSYFPAELFRNRKELRPEETVGMEIPTEEEVVIPLEEAVEIL